MILNAKTAEVIPGIRKAAILLITLGEQASADLIKDLPEEDVQRVSREIALINRIEGEQAESVLEEFNQLTMAGDFIVRGGFDYAKKVLMSAFPADTAKKLLDRLTKALGTDVVSLDVLQKADPQQLAKFIHSEHPQTIALVLSHLNPSQAAALLVSLPPNMRSDVALRMASLDQISPEIITKIATIIGQKLKTLGEFSRESYGGVRAVSEMFNRLDSNSSKEILDNIEAQDANLVETIRHLMFVFEDLLLIDQSGIKEVLGKVDRKVLTVALKGTSEQLKEHFLSCMSQRGAEMLREDMEALGPIKIKEVEAAQQQIIAIVRQLESEGTVSLKGTVGRAVCRLRFTRGASGQPAEPLIWPRVDGNDRARDPGGGDRGRSGGSARRRCNAKPSGACRKRARLDFRTVGHSQDGRRSGDQGLERTGRQKHRSNWRSCGRDLRRQAEADLVRLALAIARRILHRELTVDPEAMRGLVKAASRSYNPRRSTACGSIHPRKRWCDRCWSTARRRARCNSSQIPRSNPAPLSSKPPAGNLDASVETQLREIERGLTDRLDRT